MKPLTVPIPATMAHLPLDPRGFPIFFGAYVETDGTAHFTINDDRKRALMIEHDLCSICGKKLLRGRWFCGGPRSAFDPKGAYIDMPMHADCVHYALKVCPYLAAPHYGREVGTLKAAQVKDAIIAIDPTMIPDRPPLFVALMAVGQKMVGQHPYVKPSRPYRRVEYWQHGEQLSEALGRMLCQAFMKGETDGPQKRTA